MRNYLYVCGFFIAVAAGGLAGFGCTDNSGNGPGNPGAGGTAGSSAGAGTAGTTGTGGTSSGGAGGTTPGFMSVLPCTSESAYATGTTVSFPTSASDFSYNPKCLKVSAGATVTFSGDFSSHPLMPSAKRGTLTGNPITSTSTGTSTDFTFPTPGFYGYFCAVHDPNDTGNFMSGIIWVQ
jgi:plastocyanin